MSDGTTAPTTSTSTAASEPSTTTAAATGAAPAAAPYGDEKNFPQTAKEAPLTGILAGEGVPFKDQVAGHAKYFAGMVTRNDKEVQEGAARVRGDDKLTAATDAAAPAETATAEATK